MSSELVNREELVEMFETAFLPKLKEISERARETVEEPVKFFNVQLHMQFDDNDEPLSYERAESRLLLRMTPITQTDIDKAAEGDVGDEKLDS